MIIGLILFGNTLMTTSALSQTPLSSVDNEMILRVREDVKESATTKDNLHERHRGLRAWIRQLLNDGTYIDTAFSREQAEELKDLIRRNIWKEACTQVDDAFRNLEELLIKIQKKKQEPLQNKILYQDFSFYTIANKVKIIKSLPVGESGVEIRKRPEFITSTATGIKKNSFVTLEISNEPIWIIEGDLPQTKNLKSEHSPFGFHPASLNGQEEDYSLAREIGVDWDRAMLYLLWVFGQPDLEKKQYDWINYDRYFKNLPDGMKPLKNICVVMPGMIGRWGQMMKHRPKVTISQHLEGTTYCPKDAKAYGQWVEAIVERYDGDGKNDMPGLKTPAKYWQPDNEPHDPPGRKEYAELVRITRQAIKKADPTAKVLIGGLILPVDDFRLQTYKRTLPIVKALNGQYIDILDMHWYGQVGEWKMLPEMLVIVRKDMQACGFDNIPIWFTEMGTYNGKPHMPIHFQWQSERDQASEMVKRYVVALGEGVEKIFWAWGITEGFQDPKDNDLFDNTGIVYDGIGPGDPGKGVKKISYWTYQKITQMLQYWNGSRPQKIDTGKDIFAYRFLFSNNENRGIVVAWTGD